MDVVICQYLMSRSGVGSTGAGFFMCKLVGAELRLPVFLSLLGENTFDTIMRLLKQGTNILSYVRI